MYTICMEQSSSAVERQALNEGSQIKATIQILVLVILHHLFGVLLLNGRMPHSQILLLSFFILCNFVLSTLPHFIQCSIQTVNTSGNVSMSRVCLKLLTRSVKFLECSLNKV